MSSLMSGGGGRGGPSLTSGAPGGGGPSLTSGGPGGGGSILMGNAGGPGSESFVTPKAGKGGGGGGKGFFHGVTSGLSGAYHGFVPGVIGEGTHVGHWALHSSPVAVIAQAATEGKKFKPSDLILGRHTRKSVTHVVQPSVASARQFWSHPVRNVQQGHIGEPFMEALTVGSAGIGRVVAASAAEGSAATRAALLTGRMQGSLEGKGFKVSATPGGVRDIVTKEAPRSGYRYARGVAINKALTSLPHSTPIIGEASRAGRAIVRQERKAAARLFSNPDVRKYVDLRNSMSPQEIAAFRLRGDVPDPKDLAAQKEVWAAGGEEAQQLVRAIDSDPKIEEYYNNPSAKMQKLRDLHQKVGAKDEAALMERGAITPDQIELGIWRHTLQSRGVAPVTKLAAYKQIRKIDASIAGVERGQAASGKVVTRSAKSWAKALKQTQRASKNAARAQARAESRTAKYGAIAGQAQDLGDYAHNLSDQVSNLARGHVDTKALSDLGIVMPETTSFHGLAGAFMEAEIRKEMEGFKRSLSRLDPETANPNWREGYDQRIAALEAEQKQIRDELRGIAKDTPQFSALHSKAAQPRLDRIANDLSTLRGRRKSLTSTSAMRAAWEEQLAKRQQDLEYLGSGASVSPATEDARMSALGQLHDRLSGAYDAYERALFEKHGIERQQQLANEAKARHAGTVEAQQQVHEAHLETLRQQREELVRLGGVHENLSRLREDVGGTPKVASGMTRLYRVSGGLPSTNVPEWMASHPDLRSAMQASGRWFSNSLAEANWYLRHEYPGGRIHYIDLPKEMANAHRVDHLGNARASFYSKRPTKEYFLSDEHAGQALPFSTGARGRWASPETIAALKQEFADRGIDEPLYQPDQPGGQVPGVYSLRRPTLSPPREGLTVHEATGELFAHGMFDLTGDTFTQRHFDVANQVYQYDVHQRVLKVADGLPPNESLPKGFEFVRRYRGERIPVQAKAGAEHLGSLEDAFKLPKMEFTSADANLDPAEIAHDERGNRLIVPTRFANQFRSEVQRSQKFHQLLNSRYLTIWRHLVLHTRIPWLLSNIYGNTILAGVRFAGDNGLAAFADMVYRSKGVNALRRMMKISEKAGISDEWWNEHFPGQGRQGTFYGSNIPENPLTNTKVGRVVAKLGRFTTSLLPRADIAYERTLRRGGLAAELRASPEVKQAYKALPKGEKSWETAFTHALEDNPHLADRVEREIDDALGSYQSLTPTEREQVRQVIPFYAWYREIARITLKLPFDHPGRAYALMQLGQIGQQYEPQNVPWYMQGNYALGPNSYLNVRSANPYLSTLDMARGAQALFTLHHPSTESLNSIAGMLNPGFGATLGTFANPRRSRGIVPQLVLGPLQGMQQYQVLNPPKSKLYPGRSRLDLLRQYAGDPYRGYDPAVAAARVAAGQG